MDQDEEMDVSPLTQPFFATDERGVGNDDRDKRQGEDRDSGQEEDPGSPVEGDEEEEDADVSIIRRVSARIQAKKSVGTNGRRHSASEESSEDEDTDEEEEKMAGKALKHFPASTQSQTVTS